MKHIKEVAKHHVTYTPRLSLKDLELYWVSESFNKNDHNITITAEALGISRSTLYRKLREIDAVHQSRKLPSGLAVGE